MRQLKLFETTLFPSLRTAAKWFRKNFNNRKSSELWEFLFSVRTFTLKTAVTYKKPLRHSFLSCESSRRCSVNFSAKNSEASRNFLQRDGIVSLCVWSHDFNLDSFSFVSEMKSLLWVKNERQKETKLVKLSYFLCDASKLIANKEESFVSLR